MPASTTPIDVVELGVADAQRAMTALWTQFGHCASFSYPSNGTTEKATMTRKKLTGTGDEAIEHGKDIAQETAQQAAETAKQQTREHSEQMQESVSQRT